MTTTATAPPTVILESVDQIRADLGISISALAVAVGTTQPTMSRTLSGRVKNPDPRLIAACLIYLGRLMQKRAQA